MKEPNCAVYKFTRETGFTDDSEYEAHESPPGLHTATYNTLNKEWTVYQPLTLDDVDPSHLIMVAWADESGLVTSITAPDLDTLQSCAPLWAYFHAIGVIHHRNKAEWLRDDSSVVVSNLAPEEETLL